MTLWPIIEFIVAFSLGAGLGSWDVIRIQLGVPTQTLARRSAVTMQTLGIIMLVLVGSTTYEQHHDSEQRQRNSDCQTARNQVFSDGIKARADAQSAFTTADIAFTDADEAWVREQIRVLDAARDHTLTTAEQNQLLDQWRVSLTVKLASARAKQKALRDLNDSRDQNPVEAPQNC